MAEDGWISRPHPHSVTWVGTARFLLLPSTTTGSRIEACPGRSGSPSRSSSRSALPELDNRPELAAGSVVPLPFDADHACREDAPVNRPVRHDVERLDRTSVREIRPNVTESLQSFHFRPYNRTRMPAARTSRSRIGVQDRETAPLALELRGQKFGVNRLATAALLALRLAWVDWRSTSRARKGSVH